jgi:hypothetical protein
LDLLESKLMDRLKPVQPDPQFVERVGDRLRSVPQVVIEHQRSNLTPLISVVWVLLGFTALWLLYKGLSHRRRHH